MIHLNVIACIDYQNRIGYNNQLIYDITEDKHFFKYITICNDINNENSINQEVSNIVIMGKNTWYSINQKPLSNRINIIISNDISIQKQIQKFNNVYLYNNLNSFIQNIETIDNLYLFNHLYIKNIFVIGGSYLYKEVINTDNSCNHNEWCISQLFITKVNNHKLTKNQCQELDSINNNDFIYFPEIDKDTFKLTKSIEYISKNNRLNKEIFKNNNTNQTIFLSFNLYQNKKIINITNNNDNSINNNINKESFYNFINDLINRSKIKYHEEYQYLNIMNDLLLNGEERQTRNSITKSNFGLRMEFNLENNKIPILTTKKVAIKTVLKELLWFISGDTNNKTLQQQGVHIWDGNSSREYLDLNGFQDREEGELGPIYGFQWRHFGTEYKDCHTDYKDKGVDQLKECIHMIKNNPTSRRMIVNAWNVKDLNIMSLPPCHILFQWYVSKDNKLSLQLYQRSGDFFLGIPFNITSYSLLIYMVAHITGLKPGRLIHIIGDAHIYESHTEAINKQLNRIPTEFPQLKINRVVKDIDDFKLEDFEFLNYHSFDTIKAPMIS